MTAKPQPMAGQSDAADDLIAELAKLMAQDAQGERPAQPAVPTFTVRIPGGEPDKAATPASTFDFARPAMAPSSPVPQPVPATPPQPQQPKPAAEEAPEPFSFDFGISAPRHDVGRSPTPAAPVSKAPEPTAEPLPVAVVAPPTEQAAPPSEEHDSIADLIAAELSADPHPLPASPPPVAAPVAAAEPQPAPVRSWVPTSVATNTGGGDQRPRPAMRPVNLQPAPKSEQDRFKVPPVFGLGTAPAPSAPLAAATAPYSDIAPAPVEREEPVAPVTQGSSTPPVVTAPVAARAEASDEVGLDPIDEIESLIGRAMRVEFDKPAAEQKPVPSPALRSLATPVAPPAPAPHALSAADEAIFAAAQASGAQVGWVEAPEVSELEPAPGKPKRERRQRAPRSFGLTRALVGPLVAVTLLLAAGIGLYWVLGLGRDSGPAPLLTADATPVKETPAAQPEAAPQQSVVFNEMDGVVPGAEEQLVSRDQTDVNEVTQVAATPDLSEEGLANRKVRTVTVRPDGTIVSGDESVAGNAILPVDRPNVPAVPGASTAIPDLIASAQAETTPAAATPTAATPAATVTPEPAAPVAAAAPAITPVQPGSTVPAVDASGNPITGKTAVVPRLRPATFAQPASALPASPVTAVVDPAAGPAPVSAELQQPAAAPATQPAAIPPGATEVEAVGNTAPAYVQLASQRSEAEARATAGAMVTRFGPLFGGANMEVQRVDLGAKGIYYRVRVPANSMQEANTMCTNVKAAGGDCFTM